MRNLVVNITSSIAGTGYVFNPDSKSGPLDREHLRSCRRCVPDCAPAAPAKAVRVTAVSTDQLVPCPTSGGFMRLSDAQVFECKRCDLAIRVEGVLKRMESGA
jgi:hypothetical protein